MNAMKIMPSILTSDLARLADEIARVPSADAIHIDVMDNHFVPNLTLGKPVIQAVRAVTDKPIDVHLMIEDADRWAPEYATTGVQTITFHAEAAKAPIRLARELRKLGVRASIAFCPATPVDPFIGLLDEYDQVLVMTVEPGFGGQTFVAPMLHKTALLRDEANRLGLDLDIQVDGGVSLETVGQCARAGVNVAVAGAAVYQSVDPDQMVRALKQAAEAS